MFYQRNDNLDFISAGNTVLAAFDPDTGDTHFFDETGVTILDILSVPHTIEGLVDRLCEIYSTEPATIIRDLEEFLAEATSKRVIYVL